MINKNTFTKRAWLKWFFIFLDIKLLHNDYWEHSSTRVKGVAETQSICWNCFLQGQHDHHPQVCSPSLRYRTLPALVHLCYRQSYHAERHSRLCGWDGGQDVQSMLFLWRNDWLADWCVNHNIHQSVVDKSLAIVSFSLWVPHYDSTALHGNWFSG